MSEPEDPSSQDPKLSNEPTSKNSPSSDPQASVTPTEPLDSSSSESDFPGCSLGCFVGILYMVIVFWGAISFLNTLYSRQILFDILVIIGPLPVLYYAKKNNKRAFFWGFLIPYLMVLLIFGQCNGFLSK